LFRVLSIAECSHRASCTLTGPDDPVLSLSPFNAINKNNHVITGRMPSYVVECLLG
jgi:hypothetical protein